MPSGSPQTDAGLIVSESAAEAAETVSRLRRADLEDPTEPQHRTVRETSREAGGGAHQQEDAEIRTKAYLPGWGVPDLQIRRQTVAIHAMLVSTETRSQWTLPMDESDEAKGATDLSRSGAGVAGLDGGGADSARIALENLLPSFHSDFFYSAIQGVSSADPENIQQVGAAQLSLSTSLLSECSGSSEAKLSCRNNISSNRAGVLHWRRLYLLGPGRSACRRS